MIKPDVLVTVRFLPSSEGGLKGPTPSNYFGAMMEYGGGLWDCRLLLGTVGAISPGQTVSVPIKFVSPKHVRPPLQVGDTFRLRGSRVIAEGTLAAIYDSK